MENTTRKVYARNTKLVEIGIDESLGFFAENHRSGRVKKTAGLYSLGLTVEGEIVAAVLFGAPRTSAMSRKYSFELLRMAFKNNVRVVGGASKLIKGFIEKKSPSDFFTYQDTTGETTAVYEHAGMTLVSQTPRKQYLVAPGKTLATASRQEALGMAYATRYGPDRILGTKLGEVFAPDGKRKSNKDIFISDLGWHVESTTGDRVYEWVDFNKTHYTYKITALNSDKYYYGVSHIKKANATIEDCLSDGYMGSGGTSDKNKFSIWKKKHKTNLIKEVVSLHKTAAEAYQQEIELIGENYKTDPLCLNETFSGKTGGNNTQSNEWSDKECVIHGISKHKGSSCMKCAISALISKKECPIHGITKYRGDSCTKCYVSKAFTVKKCDVHGETVHKGVKCQKCQLAKQIIIKKCDVHGETKHRNNVCQKCRAQDNISVEVCPNHGSTIHSYGKCVSCSNSSMFTVRLCEVHGETKHQGESCSRCLREGRTNILECAVHGLTKFNGSTCAKCVVESTSTVKICKVHGETIYQGDSCAKCSAQRVVSVKTCSIHGEVKHHGEKCSTCTNEASRNEKECPVHGLSKHIGDTCYKCSTAKQVDIKECAVHGLSKHRGKSCYKCIRAKSAASR